MPGGTGAAAGDKRHGCHPALKAPESTQRACDAPALRVPSPGSLFSREDAPGCGTLTPGQHPQRILRLRKHRGSLGLCGLGAEGSLG